MSSDDEGGDSKIDDELRDAFLEEGHLQAPELLRVIDIDATCLSGEVVLVDFWEQEADYVAISHTYGMEVYEVFDCLCTTKFCSEQVPPRCSAKPCPHEMPGAAMDQRNRVVNDILGMCGILREAGVKYAWHDGVCIAQHDKEEVDATIQCMGWIYFSASETIVFLHYVGRPMAPIAPRGSSVYEPTCRWHTRVWTVQEAALSRSRRYCMRVCTSTASNPNYLVSFSPGECLNLEDFEQKVEEFESKIGLWYRDESSKVAVISERTLYFDILNRLQKALEALRLEAERLHITSESSAAACVIHKWYNCVDSLLVFLSFIMFDVYPTNPVYFHAALHQCSLRDSKHVGDRINSILGLAEVHDFVVPKDDLQGMEAWTMDFFQRIQVEPGLALAAFCVNVSLEWSDRQYMKHSWVPVLWRPLEVELNPNVEEEEGINFSVREDDGKLELQGKLMCVAVKFTIVQLQEDLPLPIKNDASSEADLQHVYPQLMKIKDAHDEQLLHMNLIFKPQARHIFSNAMLSLAPTCYMGSAVFPTFRCEDTTESCLDIGGEFVRIRDGECFNACLVFSLLSKNPAAVDRPTLIVHRCRRRRRWCLQAWYPQLRRWCLQAWYLLLRQCRLQADIDLHDVKDDHVFKLGTFRMSDLFLRIACDPAHPACTIIEKLVII